MVDVNRVFYKNLGKIVIIDQESRISVILWKNWINKALKPNTIISITNIRAIFRK